jgi:hypothetical protein
MEDDAVDLQMGPAIPVAPGDFDIRVDGVNSEEANAIRRLVANILERQRNMKVAAPPKQVSQELEAPVKREEIQVGLVGPSTNLVRQRELEDAIRTAVAEELGRDRPAGNPNGTCICISGVPGDRLPFSFLDMTTGTVGTTVPWFTNGRWNPPPGGRSFWRIGVLFDSAPFNEGRLIVRDGSTFNPPVRKDQALVGLANATDWAKEIWADNLCSGRIGSVFQEGTNATPRRMLLDRAVCREGADTIVFRKPGFFGIWHDVGHFASERFWEAFGGTWGDYTWEID